MRDMDHTRIRNLSGVSITPFDAVERQASKERERANANEKSRQEEKRQEIREIIRLFYPLDK
jgi:GTP cyclohydrolase III